MLITVEIILGSWVFLANTNLACFLILTLVAELGREPSVGSGGYGHVGGILCGLLLLFIHFTSNIHFPLVSRVVRLLTVLIGRRVQLGANCFL